jgi:hypothetical protein
LLKKKIDFRREVIILALMLGCYERRSSFISFVRA